MMIKKEKLPETELIMRMILIRWLIVNIMLIVSVLFKRQRAIQLALIILEFLILVMRKHLPGLKSTLFQKKLVLLMIMVEPLIVMRFVMLKKQLMANMLVWVAMLSIL